MRVHLVNPSHVSFGVGVITPRWLFVLAAATPARFGAPHIVDETLEVLDPETVQPGDVVGIGIHTGNALRGYEVGRLVRERGATVIFGGIHTTLYPDEPRELGGAHAVVKGDGDVAWGQALYNITSGRPAAAVADATPTVRENDYLEKIAQIQKAWDRELQSRREELNSEARAIEELEIIPTPRNIEVTKYVILWAAGLA